MEPTSASAPGLETSRLAAPTLIGRCHGSRIDDPTPFLSHQPERSRYPGSQGPFTTSSAATDPPPLSPDSIQTHQGLSDPPDSISSPAAPGGVGDN